MLEIATEMAQRYGGEAGLAYLRGTLDKPRYLLKLDPPHGDDLERLVAPALRLSGLSEFCSVQPKCKAWLERRLG